MNIAEVDVSAGYRADDSAEDDSLQLPYDRLKTPALSRRAARHGFVLDRDPADALIESGRLAPSQRGALLLATCGALFYRYSGQTAIPLALSTVTFAGSPRVAGRQLSLALDGGMAFLDLVAAAGALLSAIEFPHRASAEKGEPAGIAEDARGEAEPAGRAGHIHPDRESVGAAGNRYTGGELAEIAGNVYTGGELAEIAGNVYTGGELAEIAGNVHAGGDLAEIAGNVHTGGDLAQAGGKGAKGSCGDRTLAIALGEGAGVDPDWAWRFGNASSYDLQLVFMRSGTVVAVDFIYNALLFEAATIERLAGHWRTLLVSAAAGPERTLAELALFTPRESAWLRERGTGGTRAFAPEPVHRDVERQARAQAGKTAVRFRDRHLSYAALDRRANRLAHYLLSRGAGAESRIVVCIEPSLDIAVALLGILKAGAVYVPLNPAYPALRIETILEDTAPALIVTHSALARAIDFGGRPQLCLDGGGDALAAQPEDTPAVAIDPDQSAYIYYTSGTTGKPKGVMASHANLINYIRVAQEKYGFNRDDVMPAMASFTFSISMFELLSPLVAGGTLLLLERAHILDPSRMVETLREISFIHAGPSLLKNLVAYIEAEGMEPGLFSGIRHLSSGGDMIPPELLRKLQSLLPRAELYVIYGCSEVSCMGCTWFIEAGIPVAKTLVGKPFANVHTLVLDDAGNRVPVGAVGDVCIGGDGVVKGYLRRPELTEEKFFSRDGIRFYRTGDRGRLNADGDLELLGRRDFQVQLRGMRIELGEIEYHLRQAPGVRDGVVAAGDGPSGAGLVAYFVAAKPGAADGPRLREHLRRHLPDYMVPAFYCELEALPLNHNLKVDRKALPAVAALPPALRSPARKNAEACPPETVSERELAAIWCRLLRLEAVDLRDNFLVLGGDSLLAMELIASAEKRLKVRLDGMDILRESLRVLAAICDRQLRRVEEGANTAPALSIEVNPCEGLFFGAGDSLYGLLHFPPRSNPFQNGKSRGRNSPARETPAGVLRRETAFSHNSGRPPVLICPPLGQEYARCYFFLKTLADRLSEQGFPVLRFDYFGTGDSLGESREASLQRWRADVAAALELLSARTGGGPVQVLGVRMGALLALTGLPAARVANWVLWDPVVDGALHYRELTRMHREKIRHLRVIRNWKRPRAIPGAEELLGLTCSETTVAQLRQCSALKGSTLKSVGLDGCAPQEGGWNTGGALSGADIVISERGDPQSALLESARACGNIHRLDVHCGWYESYSFNRTIIDKNIAQKLLAALGSSVKTAESC